MWGYYNTIHKNVPPVPINVLFKTKWTILIL